MQTIQLQQGVTLRCFPAERFKQGCLSLQFLRPLSCEENAINALFPSVLLRGSVKHPDMRSITMALDDLYGASIGSLVRRVGDYHAVGFYCGFIEDRFALAGDRILEPMIDLMGELLLEPKTVDGCFDPEFVQSEKRNLIAAIESERNDKRTYTLSRMLERMCSADSLGIRRLGKSEQVEAIDGPALWSHYQKVLRESPVEIFYVGSGDPKAVAEKLRALFDRIPRMPIALPEQTAFHDGGRGDYVETMEITQAKLCMGFVCPVINKSKEFATVQVFNSLYGAGMTCKLFTNVREKMSLCYYIGSNYYGNKGIMVVSAGIDADKETVVRQEIMNQLEACCQGQITAEELAAAKEMILSGLRSVYDSVGSIESYETLAIIGGLPMTVKEYYQAVEAVTAEQVAEVAKTVQLHTTYLLKGVEA